MPCPCRGHNDREKRLQRQTTIQQEAEFKTELEHLFSQQGNQGVRRHELEDALQETGITEVIPMKKLRKLLRKADLDQDSFITYTEFMTLYNTANEQLSKREKTAMRRFVGMAITNIVPLRMREDFLQNYTCSPPPVFMIIVSLLEIGVFIYYAVELSKKGVPVTATTGLPDHSPLVYTPTRRYEAWRFITYMFLHQGYVHLVFNLIFQLLLGLPLEIVHKWWRLLIVYMGGVIGGSLGHSVTDHSIQLVGASGGCYALIGAHLASVIVNWKEMNYKCSECDNPIRIVTSAPVRLAVLFLLAGADTVNAIYRRFIDPVGAKIGISAHIGGLLTGLLMGVPLMKNINELHWEKKVGWVTLRSLGHSVTDHSIQLVGASGGCYALIGAHLASVIVNWKEMNYKCSECDNPIRIVTSAPVRLAVLFLLAGADTVNAIYRRFIDPVGAKIGISAHIGGLLTGLLMGVPLMKNINELHWEKKVGWVTLSIYVISLTFCIMFNGLYKGYPETDYSPCC